MRRFALLSALSILFVLGACSSSDVLSGPDSGSPVLQEGNESSSNNGSGGPKP